MFEPATRAVCGGRSGGGVVHPRDRLRGVRRAARGLSVARGPDVLRTRPPTAVPQRDVRLLHVLGPARRTRGRRHARRMRTGPHRGGAAAVSGLLIGVVLLALMNVAFKAIGPALLGDRDLPAALQRVLDAAGPGLLASLVAADLLGPRWSGLTSPFCPAWPLRSDCGSGGDRIRCAHSPRSSPPARCGASPDSYGPFPPSVRGGLR